MSAQIKFPQSPHYDCNVFFSGALDVELDKIVQFYARKETELLGQVADLWHEIRTTEDQELVFAHGQQAEQNDGPKWSADGLGVAVTPDHTVVTTETPSAPANFAALLWASPHLATHTNSLSARLVSVYVALFELAEYVEINETGFSKVLKKYDKVVGTRLKPSYLVAVERALPFAQAAKRAVQTALDKTTGMYARVCTEGKRAVAHSDLKTHVRARVVWERNTIWRDMVENERRQQTIAVGTEPTISHTVRVRIFGLDVNIPQVIPAKTLVILLACTMLLVVANSGAFKAQEQNNCLAILVFASILWAFEAIPLFVTALLVPLLVVVMQVMRDQNGVRLDGKAAAKRVFSEMFGPVIMLLLGGFSLAAALSKHNIAKQAAGSILRRAGSKPHQVLLANMFVSTFASMWISNVAAPVLCFSLISPILRNLPHKSPYARCLVLGIAMAANVGGMASPIASPQNIIAVANMKPAPSWLQWFAIALPMCITVDLAIWALLLLVYRPAEQTTPPEMYANQHISEKNINPTQMYIIFVTVLTIGLWCVASSIEGVFGDMGVIAIIPIVLFYGAGILTKDDWNSMLWSVVVLAMGGIALGKAVESSGLLHALSALTLPFLQAQSLFTSLALITAIIIVITSFISHTVGALIVLPVVAQIGASLADPHPRTFVMAAGKTKTHIALMCSGGMCLPVSSFPNMNAISLEDATGTPWLTVKDFLVVGVISSVIAWMATMTIAYVTMTLMNFQ